MKWLIKFILVVLITPILFGCDSENGTSSNVGSTPQVVNAINR